MTAAGRHGACVIMPVFPGAGDRSGSRESAEEYVDFRFTEEQELLRANVREFAEKEIAPDVMKYDESQEFPREIPPTGRRRSGTTRPPTTAWPRFS